ncbi:MAG: S41 family peptidase, partial [bacterium]|nr:S41 family peptidase [bacterium]
MSRRRPSLWVVVAGWGVFALAATTFAQGRTADDDPRFGAAWRLVAERYWDLSLTSIDWDAAYAEFGARPAADDDALDEVLEALYEAIGDDHSRYVPAQRVAIERELYGDLPCVAVFAQAGIARSAASDAPPVQRSAGPVTFGAWPDGIGYLRLDDLVQARSAEGVRQAVVALERDGATGLVLDLRGNPGGRLVTMMQVAGVFTRGFLWRALTRWSLPIPYPALGAPATAL